MPSVVEEEIRELMCHFEGHMVAAVAQRGDDVLFEDVLEVKDGETISAEKVRKKYVFPLGSASKIIAGFALYILLDKLDDVTLDDPVSKHVLGFEGAEHVTIRSLLTHKSGLPKGNDFVLGPAGNPLQDRDAALSTIKFLASKIPKRNHQIESEIETDKFQYSNVGYLLLAQVMESISGGKAYHEVLEEVIFVPYEMKNTYVSRSKYENRDKDVILAPPYLEVDEGVFEEIDQVLYFEDTALLPAFGICSTLQDMKKFFSGLLKAHHASKEDALHLPIPEAHGFLRFNQEVTGRDTRYGAGACPQPVSPADPGPLSQHMQTMRRLKQEPPFEPAYHGGAVRGYECSFDLRPTENQFFFSFSNATSLGDMADDIRRLLISHYSQLPIEFAVLRADIQKRRKDRVRVVADFINNFRAYTKQPSRPKDMTNLEGEYIASECGLRITISEKNGHFFAVIATTATSRLGNNGTHELAVRFFEHTLTICPETQQDFLRYLGNDFLSDEWVKLEIQTMNGRVTGLKRHLEDGSMSICYDKV